MTSCHFAVSTLVDCDNPSAEMLPDCGRKAFFRMESIAMRFTTCEMMQHSAELLAYGTGVVVEDAM